MGYRPASFDTVQESPRSSGIPVFERFFRWETIRWETIKRAIDFDGRKLCHIIPQLSACRQIRGIEGFGPAFIRPATCSDINRSGFHSNTPQSGQEAEGDNGSEGR